MPEMIIFMDTFFSITSLNEIGKFVLVTVTLMTLCVTLANVIKSVMVLK